FWANQFRLLLHAAAYWLLDTLRRRLCAHGYPSLQLDTLRLRLLKVGGPAALGRQRPANGDKGWS
ncbi:MAG: transposase, partial [Chloroflexi bacterium]|nr:transposase [Chloroflexota bacterium]